MSELSILNQLVAAGMTPIGACAMAGNMQAESALRANNAQDGMTKLTDEEYTKAADTWSIDFADDSIGYGLCQWTYPTRKAALLGFAIDRGKSVGNEQMQVDFCVWEIQHNYPDLWGYLCMTQDLSGATDRICREYERPAVNNTSVRTMYANELYMQYGDKLESTTSQVNRTETESNRTRAIGNAQGAFEGIKDVGCVGEQGVCGLTTQCRGKLMPVIKRGDKSPEAHYLRKLLENLGYDTVWDGVWEALVDYQQKRGLTVDGICGKETWARLMQEGK